jgi:hypothetical protein
VSFLDSLKRVFGSAGWPGRSDGTDSSGGSGSPGERVVAMIPCEEASARLFEYLDGELEDLSEEEVRHHLEICTAVERQGACARGCSRRLRRTRARTDTTLEGCTPSTAFQLFCPGLLCSTHPEIVGEASFRDASVFGIYSVYREME